MITLCNDTNDKKLFIQTEFRKKWHKKRASVCLLLFQVILVLFAYLPDFTLLIMFL